MNESGRRVLEAARSRIGRPFRHHFKPDNFCEYGKVTVDACMEQGLDDEGYDCSGLVIASICDVLDLNTADWPREYRHMNQFTQLEVAAPAKAGDCLLFHQALEHRTHMAIMATEETVIHASGISKLVEEGKVEGEIIRTGVVPSEVLLKVASASGAMMNK